MSHMNWAVDVASQHPDLQGALITTSGPWLDILLPDGRAFRFRPLELLRDDMPVESQKDRLNKLLTIGAKGATKAPVSEPDMSDAPVEYSDPQDMDNPEAHPVLPLVRAADFFVSTRNGLDDSPIFLPLTDFIGVGLGRVDGDQVTPLFFHDLHVDPTAEDLYPLFQKAVHNLHVFNAEHDASRIELGMYEGNGSQVLIMETPAPHQCSWFADVDMLQNVSTSLAKEFPDSLLLFIPATPYGLLIVQADDDFLVEAFEKILEYPPEDMIYPLPHTLASDGWLEWVPLPGHPAEQILARMRAHFRSRIYESQAEYMRQWPVDTGHIASFDTHKLTSRTVSTTVWKRSFGYGSVPKTDFITFVDDEQGGARPVTLSLPVAMDVWPEGITPLENVWPPRFEVRRFPEPATLEALRAQAHRAI